MWCSCDLPVVPFSIKSLNLTSFLCCIQSASQTKVKKVHFAPFKNSRFFWIFLVGFHWSHSKHILPFQEDIWASIHPLQLNSWLQQVMFISYRERERNPDGYISISALYRDIHTILYLFRATQLKWIFFIVKYVVRIFTKSFNWSIIFFSFKY